MITRTLDGWERDCWGWSRFWGVPPHPTTQGIWDILCNQKRKPRNPADWMTGLIGVPVAPMVFPKVNQSFGLSIDDIVCVQPMADNGDEK